MRTLIDTVWRGFQNTLDWFARNLSGLWSAFVGFMTFIADWVANFMTNLAGWVVDLVFVALIWVVSNLPEMPEPPEPGAVGALEMANRYIPLSEVAALGAMWGAVFGAVGVYKLIKLIRGGG